MASVSDEKGPLLPCAASHEIPARQSRERLGPWRLVLTVIVSLAITWQLSPRFEHSSGPEFCPQPDPRTPSPLAQTILSSAAFRQVVTDKLRGAVRIPTQSFDDLGEPGDDVRWKPFGELHAFLRDQYPLVHAHANISTLSAYSLVFEIVGSDSMLKPVMLTAHQDVVPAGDPTAWTHPPFESWTDGEWIWGRGATETKSTLITVLSAVEAILQGGFAPRRTILLAFGQDEEVRGRRGSKAIAELLEERWGYNGIELIVDEGMGPFAAYGATFAPLAIAEKVSRDAIRRSDTQGYADLRIDVHAPGGHSARPAPRNANGILAALATAYDDSTAFAPELHHGDPLVQFASCLAAHANAPRSFKKAVRSRDWPALRRFFVSDVAAVILATTTKALTILKSGSEKVNVVPPAAYANVNHRLAVGASVDDLVHSILGAVTPTARRLDVELHAFGKKLLDGKSGHVTLSLHDVEEASAISSSTSPGYNALASAFRTIWPDTIVSPFVLGGYTDVRRYANLSSTIIRTAPNGLNERLNAHGPDERVTVKSLVEATAVYVELILDLDGRHD